MSSKSISIHHRENESYPLSKGLILLMAIAAGMAVANLYYNQPLLAQIGSELHESAQKVGMISMSTQIGYAVGMFLFVPLGDMVERRQLIFILLLCVMLSLIGVATAQNLLWMVVASFAVGITTVVPQIIVPLAANLAAPKERGKVIGNVMSGLLIGILLARTISGFIGGWLGWRSMYWVAALLMLLLAIIMRYLLPPSYPDGKLTYSGLMSSIGKLIAEQRTLREASMIGAMMFGAFSVFWTSLTFFVEGAPFHYGSQVAGLFGLVGVVGAAAASLVGRLADQYSPRTIIGVAIGIGMLSYVTFGLFGSHLWGLVLGVILLDLGVQGAQIANQARIYTLVPEARSRITTVFMVSTFLGGAIGSSVGSLAWGLWQWSGVCLTGGSMVCLAIIIWGVHRLKA